MATADQQQTQTMTIEDAIQIAIQHHQNGELEEARNIYHQILKVEPDYPDALHLLGVVAHQAGRDDRALELIQRAIQVRPDQAMYYNNLGEALRALGRLEESIPQYRMALEIQPDLLEAMNNLGLLFMEMGQLEEATTFFRKVLEVQPDFVLGLNNLGHCLRTRGKLEEAIQLFQQALQIRPDDALAKQNLQASLNEYELSTSYDPAVAARLRSNAPDPMRTYIGVEEEEAQKLMRGRKDEEEWEDEAEAQQDGETAPEQATSDSGPDNKVAVKAMKKKRASIADQPGQVEEVKALENEAQEAWRTRYPISYYNPKYDTLKVPLMLWVVILFLMRHVLLLILGTFGRTPWVMQWALEKPLFFIADLFPFLVAYGVGNRLPEAGPKMRMLAFRALAADVCGTDRQRPDGALLQRRDTQSVFGAAGLSAR